MFVIAARPSMGKTSSMNIVDIAVDCNKPWSSLEIESAMPCAVCWSPVRVSACRTSRGLLSRVPSRMHRKGHA